MDNGNLSATHWEKYRSLLMAKAQALVASRWRTYFEPSDIVQNTLLEAHQHASQLASLDEYSFIAWLRRALKHNFLDALKRVKTQKQDARRTIHASELEALQMWRQAFVAADTSPSQIAQRDELLLLMFAAIEELPRNQRLAITLKHLEGHSLREVSQALGLSEPAVAGLLHRGRRQLMDRVNIEATVSTRRSEGRGDDER